MNKSVTRAEFARSLGIDRTTLWRWETAGLIPAADRVSYRRAVYDPGAQIAIRAFAEAGR